MHPQSNLSLPLHLHLHLHALFLCIWCELSWKVQALALALVPEERVGRPLLLLLLLHQLVIYLEGSVRFVGQAEACLGCWETPIPIPGLSSLAKRMGMRQWVANQLTPMEPEHKEVPVRGIRLQEPVKV